MVTAGWSSQVDSEKAWRTACRTRSAQVSAMQPAMEGATVGWPYLMRVGGDWAKEADDGLALAGHDA